MLTASTSRALSFTTFLASFICCLWLCLVSVNAHAEQNEPTIQELTEEAEQGNPYAQLLLALRYDNGQGVPQDYKKAIYYATLAANQGYAEAQFNLGVMYANGQGVPQNYTQAYAHAIIAYALDPTQHKLKDILESELTPAQKEKGQEIAAKIWEKLPK